ncbi:MAG TPA: hypothetical protein DEA26_01935 [Oceanospirillales bacterium]|nr:hypothetical protein [Oceanospirillaceae bacterium]HBS41411.1 hypothetical protein [Oceanospirillales bacterium]|tara:strand:- start:38390 stop:39178 length:789 start_codon:yes stop_codon:yes gene_type:complete
MKKRNLLLASMMLTPLAAFAADEETANPEEAGAECVCAPVEEEAEEDTGPWSGSAELGTIFTSGNTETQTINANFAALRTGELWQNTYRLSALKTEDDGETTAEKYTAFAQFDRTLTERSYMAIVASQERDRFSGYRYQTSASINYGYRIIMQDDMSLDAEVGPGFQRDKIDGTDEIVEGAIARAALNFDWTIAEGVQFMEYFSVEAGEDNTIYRSETGLLNQISGRLASKITYKIKHQDTVPDEETEKTDTELGITLVYTF